MILGDRRTFAAPAADEQGQGGDAHSRRKREAFKIAPVFRQGALAGYQLVEVRADASRAPLAILFPTRLEALEARDALEKLNEVASMRQVFSTPLDAGAKEVLRLWSVLSDADRGAVLEMMRAAAMEAHGE